jgi:hypothetical protein
VAFKGCYFFLPPFFLPPFFLVAMFLFSLSIVHGCAVQKTAIDDCIDSMKIEVKQKIDDHLDGGRQSEMLKHETPSHIIPIFVKT